MCTACSSVSSLGVCTLQANAASVVLCYMAPSSWYVLYAAYYTMPWDGESISLWLEPKHWFSQFIHCACVFSRYQCNYIPVGSQINFNERSKKFDKRPHRLLVILAAANGFVPFRQTFTSKTFNPSNIWFLGLTWVRPKTALRSVAPFFGRNKISHCFSIGRATPQNCSSPRRICALI